MSLPEYERKNADIDPSTIETGTHIVAQCKDPIFSATPSKRRFAPRRAGTAVMLAVFVTGVIGLYRLALDGNDRARLAEPNDPPGAGIIVHSELIFAWVPNTLAELANCQSQSQAIRTHEDLREYLRRHDKKALWYALQFRAYQVNGGVVNLTFIRWPYMDALHFDELLDVLATAAGDPPPVIEPDYSRASVKIIDASLLKSDPRAAMAELLRELPEPAD